MNYIHVHEDTVSWRDAAGPLCGDMKTKLLLDGAKGVSDGFRVELVELGPGAELALHAHEQCEVDFILSGRAHVRLGASQFELDTQGSLLVPAGVPHAIAAAGDAPLLYLSTYATELKGNSVDPLGIDAAPEALDRPACKTWIRWDEAEHWWSSEKSKDMRIRVKRLTDLDIRNCELVAGIGEIDADTHYTLHYHDQPEIYYITGGEGIILVDDDEVHVTRGSVLYIAGGVVHGADNHGPDPLAIYYVYGVENSGPAMNWTAVEEIYGTPRSR